VKQMIKEWLIEEYCVRYNDERALRLLVKYAESETKRQMIVFECSELPGFFDGSKERDVVWGVEKMVNGVFQYITDLNTLYSIMYAPENICIIRFPEAGIYKVTADFIKQNRADYYVEKKENN